MLFKLQSAVLPNLVGYINIFIYNIKQNRKYQSTAQLAKICFVKFLLQFYMCMCMLGENG